MRGIMIVLLLASGVGPATAAELAAVGVLGNSGVAGHSLVRTAPYAPSRSLVGSAARTGNATGVAVDRDLTLWISGGDRLNRLALNGQLIESVPLAPAGSRIDSRTFVVHRGALYFLGRLPKGERALFRLPWAGPPAAAQVVAGARLPASRADHPPLLVDRPLRDSLGLVYEPDDTPGQTRIDLLDPDRGAWSTFATLPCDNPAGATVREDGIVFVGGRFPELTSKSAGHNTVSAIAALDPTGRMLRGFPVPSTFKGASPVQYRGDLSYADGALWELAWYGTIARRDRNAQPAPGNLSLGGPRYDLDYPSQLVNIAPGLVAITSAAPDSLHLARTGGSQPLEFVRRLGCLPDAASVGLSPNGWVVVGTPRGVRWWRWDDAPDSPTRGSSQLRLVTPGVFDGDRYFALARAGGLERPIPCVLEPDAAPVIGLWDRKQVPLDRQAVPMAEPVSLSVAPASAGTSDALAVDASQRQLWQTRFNWRAFRTGTPEWQAVRVEPPLTAPTDAVPLADGRALVADGSAVRLLARDRAGFRQEWSFHRWGPGPEEHFGPRLRLAVVGSVLLVSDTTRHRVVAIDWTTRQVLTQFGATDQPGRDLDCLDSPTLIAASGHRAVVFDSGNQRIVKLELSLR
ncbi:MAG: hypothetical protein NZ700_16915 [Gemmataceae bacterium]|nr:hypothetical protein [Gemmataceae bacterium]MDW8265382.1 hypothetical protein [Gemmataceae bacterium]